MKRSSHRSLALAVLLAAGLALSTSARAQGKGGAAKPAEPAKPAEASSNDGDRDETVLSDGPTEPPPKQAGIPFYEDLVKKNPEDPEAHQTLAAAYARVGKTDDARREVRRAIELAPNSPESHQAMGLIEEGAGNLA